jgi:hypothetical protein
MDKRYQRVIRRCKYAFLLPLGIFCPLFFLSFIDLRLLITPWYLLSIALSFFHWFTSSFYPLVSFVHCEDVNHSRTDKTMDKRYQGVIRRRKSMKDRKNNGQKFCLSCCDLRLLMTSWYLLYYDLSVLHWITSSYYPLVSFVHCI